MSELVLNIAGHSQHGQSLRAQHEQPPRRVPDEFETRDLGTLRFSVANTESVEPNDTAHNCTIESWTSYCSVAAHAPLFRYLDRGSVTHLSRLRNVARPVAWRTRG